MVELAGREFRRILIIKPSSLGDVTHALPVLEALRRRYPSAHLAWLVSITCSELLQGHPWIDEIVPFDRRHYGQMLRSARAAVAFLRFLWGLRGRRFDLVLDLQGLFRSGFLAWATGAPVRIGPAEAREFARLFYTHTARRHGPDEHAILRNWAGVRLLGISGDPPPPRLHVAPEVRDRAAALLAEAGVGAGRPFAVLAPGARWETKIWPADKMAAVAAYLHDTYGLEVVLIGGPEEATACRAVAASASVPVVNLCGRTGISDMMALIDRSEIVVSNDSGPMHVAVALGRPVVAAIGPTNPRRTGPLSPAARIARRELACSPCYIRRLAQCPHEHACMRGLEPAAVRAAIDQLLASPRQATISAT